MFPIEEINIEINQEQSAKAGRSFYFDYKTGQFMVVDGKVVETNEQEMVQQWIELLLRTKLDKYAVYKGTRFGNNAHKIIGLKSLPAGFIESEFKREIIEAVELNPLIDSVGEFEQKRVPKGLEISFTAYLVDGLESEVKLVV